MHTKASQKQNKKTAHRLGENMFIFVFLSITLGRRSEKIFLPFMSEYSAYVSSRSFMISGLTFKPLIHFRFIFVYGVRKFSLFFKLKFIYFNWRLITLQHCIGFAIHQRESTTGIHVFPILNLPPRTIPLGHPMHQPQA